MVAPCLHCLERYLACHDKCQQYQDYKKHLDLIRVKKDEDSEYTNYLYNTITKMRRSRRTNNERNTQG